MFSVRLLMQQKNGSMAAFYKTTIWSWDKTRKLTITQYPYSEIPINKVDLVRTWTEIESVSLLSHGFSACSEGQLLLHCADQEHVFLKLYYSACLYSSVFFPPSLLLNRSRNTCLHLTYSMCFAHFCRLEAVIWFKQQYCQRQLNRVVLCVLFRARHQKRFTLQNKLIYI